MPEVRQVQYSEEQKTGIRNIFSIRRGYSSRISLKTIVYITNINERRIRQIIHDLRCEGLPIVSVSDPTDSGYFLYDPNHATDNPFDRVIAGKYISEIKSRIKNMAEMISPIETLLQSEGQGRLF